MIERRAIVGAFLLFFGSPLAAQGVDTALVDAFGDCFAAETGEAMDDTTRDALAAAAPDMLDALALDCEGDACAGVIGGMDCDELADALAAPLGLSSGPPADAPPWARAFASAIVNRVSECYQAETGESLSDEQTAAVAGYQGQLVGMIGTMVDQLGCEIDESSLDLCLADVAALDCAALATGLFDGASGLAGNGGEGCSAMFDCNLGPDEEAIDALFEENRAGESGD